MTKRSTEWHKKLEAEVRSDPEARAEYEAFKLQLQVSGPLRKGQVVYSTCFTISFSENKSSLTEQSKTDGIFPLITN